MIELSKKDIYALSDSRFNRKSKVGMWIFFFVGFALDVIVESIKAFSNDKFVLLFTRIVALIIIIGGAAGFFILRKMFRKELILSLKYDNKLEYHEEIKK